MNIVKRIDYFGNTGVKKDYDPWEIYLTRKLNFLTLLGLVNVTSSVIFFSLTGFHDFIPECLMTLAVGPFVFVLNHKKNYIWAAYLFYAIGLVLFYFIVLKMGAGTYSILYYFPILISLVQILGRKETINHLLIILALFFISIVMVALAYENSVFKIEMAAAAVLKLRTFNIISTFFLAIVLIAILTMENIKQERLIKNMLNEKEILLAEVFHRVKNNMNIVTSLLNLKKHSSKSEEVKIALEECRERVFSMALVHQKIYNNKTIYSLNFKEYVSELVTESINSIGGTEKVDVDFKTENVDLPLNYAIPCGLILNELITNSFKHAQSDDKKLKIDIGLKYTDGTVNLSVKDNGPGFNFDNAVGRESLGMELIKSLSDQIDGEYSISNKNGCLFELGFQKN